MVQQFQFQRRYRLQTLGALLLSVWAVTGTSSVRAGAAEAKTYLETARAYYGQGLYFRAARYAFAASQESSSYRGEAYSWATLGLVEAGLHQSASYFFIRTLQEADASARRRVLGRTEQLLLKVGADTLRPYLVKHTRLEDYDSLNRSAFLYVVGKTQLLKSKERDAVQALSGMSPRSPLWAYALQMRGTAHAILGNETAALADFNLCVDEASTSLGRLESAAGAETSDRWVERRKREYEDLANRCRAGVARTYYQMNQFDAAELAYDKIPKKSFVWTDILYEQAWNAFAQGEYNRTLGKLVTYRSPGLSFVFNPGVEVLQAQAYLALCLYADANRTINQFNERYEKVGVPVKRFIERNSNRLGAFFELGEKALEAPLHSKNEFHRLANRFVRGPYFRGLSETVSDAEQEMGAILRFASTQPGVSQSGNEGFPGFLKQVLRWRRNTAVLLGGAYVKNSLLDYYSVLLSEADKMSFIKLEMLGRAKDKLLDRPSKMGDRSRGNVEPNRRDDQYYWGFNGEFWNDEIGDYVFGLESECNT